MQLFKEAYADAGFKDDWYENPEEIFKYLVINQWPMQERYERAVATEIQAEFTSSFWPTAKEFFESNARLRADSEFSRFSYEDKPLRPISDGGVKQLSEDISRMYGIFRSAMATHPGDYNRAWVNDQVSRRISQWAQHVDANKTFNKIHEVADQAAEIFGDPLPEFSNLGSILTEAEVAEDRERVFEIADDYIRQNPEAERLLGTL